MTEKEELILTSLEKDLKAKVKEKEGERLLEALCHKMIDALSKIWSIKMNIPVEAVKEILIYDNANVGPLEDPVACAANLNTKLTNYVCDDEVTLTYTITLKAITHHK